MVSEVLECLILTIVLECGFAFLTGICDRDSLGWIAIVNAITNPLLVGSSYLLMAFMGQRTGLMVTYVLLEPLVIFSESLLYQNKLHTRFNLLFLSLILNLISIAGGNLWRILF